MGRVVKKLDEVWKFAVDSMEIGTNERWYQTGLPAFKEVEIPHTFNIDPETVDYRGSAWYEYCFIPDHWGKVSEMPDKQ